MTGETISASPKEESSLSLGRRLRDTHGGVSSTVNPEITASHDRRTTRPNMTAAAEPRATNGRNYCWLLQKDSKPTSSAAAAAAARAAQPSLLHPNARPLLEFCLRYKSCRHTHCSLVHSVYTRLSSSSFGNRLLGAKGLPNDSEMFI